MSFHIALAIVALSGFISLSYEILWYRAFSFVTQSSPAAFGLMLGAYLTGIALGSLGSRALCKDRPAAADPRPLRALAAFVLAASLLGFLVVPAMARLVVATAKWTGSLGFVAVAAGLLGAILPLISHFGISADDRAGARLSYLYMANIAGSTSGSLLTGFVLMDHWGMQAISTFLFVLGAAAAGALLFLTRPNARSAGAAFVGTAALVGAAMMAAPALYHDVYARLMWRANYSPERAFAHVIENRSGVITVTRDGRLYGGGGYDGAFSTDLVQDKNFIVRAYALSAFHPAPRRVLMIGLASGSWAQVIASHPQVESLKIIEINPGYLELLPRFPQVESLPRNPKVEIVIDDGRRWLARHPEERFDVIVQNTTQYYRDHATNLLSREYLELTAKHLSPGGVFFYNATGSRDAQHTGATVFPHAYRLLSFVLGSESPIVLDRERWRRVLTDYRIDGRLVLDLANEADRDRLEKVLGILDTPEPVTEADVRGVWRRNLEAYRAGDRPYFDLSKEADRRRVEDIVTGREAPPLGILELARPVLVPPLETRESMLANGGRVITDDNMATEWADGVRP